MATVLDGVQVVEVADWGFVPSAGTALGDWGAEVVKIEHPRHGDPIRGLITGGMIPGASGRNFIVEQLGRQKRSVGVDLGTDEGHALLVRLIEQADVFLTNFLPDARERLRITYEDLRRVNPRLVYAKGHGQGGRGAGSRTGSRRPGSPTCSSGPPSATSSAACASRAAWRRRSSGARRRVRGSSSTSRSSAPPCGCSRPTSSPPSCTAPCCPRRARCASRRTHWSGTTSARTARRSSS